MTACAEIAGVSLPQDRFIDGMNPLPVLFGETKNSPHATLYFKYLNYAALLWGDYKIIREEEEGEWQLYDLTSDISEANNLAPQEEAIVKKMAAAYEQQEQEIQSYLMIEGSFQLGKKSNSIH